MKTYQVIYRLKADDIYRSHHFIEAEDDESAAFNALDFVKIHKYNLLDVKRIDFIK